MQPKSKLASSSMGLSFALAAAKTFGLMGIGQTFITTPMVATLIWPFVLKVLLYSRPFNQMFINTVHSSRLFFFQMGQITSDSPPPADDRRRTRWERAIMLVNQRLVIARNSQWGEDDEDSLRAVTVLAL